jgi:hypothetical protein
MNEPTTAQQAPAPGQPGGPVLTKKEAKAQAAAAKAYSKSRRNWFLRHKILTALGTLVLVIIIASLANKGGSAGTEADSGAGTAASGGTDKAAAAPAAGAAKMAGLNTAARDGQFEFTVKSVDCGKTQIGTAGLSHKAQGQFCMAKVHVMNIGKEAKMLDGSSQQAFDAKGRKFSADSEAAVYMGDDAQTFLNDINPGNAVDGTFVFDVAKGTKIAQLELHDSPFSGGVKVNVG